MSEIQVVAAGLVIFRRFQNQIQFLLLKHSYGDQHWTPPKGKKKNNNAPPHLFPKINFP